MLAETVEEWTRQWKEDGLREGRQQGLQQGLQQGESTLLQKQLERRFGALPAWVPQRLAQASPAQIEMWGLELLDAASLEDVFAGAA
ncbi:DUF4351 domain-containing protein [Accumulibacter sp.]|uniref:DUF4351 domain-containing protein n=2 Tax=Accumulibacter sp. TaxID=2053492 RepID=UPI00260F8FDA|nr:DUF4351 domain-containing protein [Accumulibacter sp.]